MCKISNCSSPATNKQLFKNLYFVLFKHFITNSIINYCNPLLQRKDIE